MNKGKPKNSVKKHISIVFVPHNSNHVKVLKFTSFYGKLFVMLAIILTAVAATGIYVYKTVNENKNLKSDLSELYNANSEQRKVIEEKTGTIDKLTEKEANFDKNVNSQINAIEEKFNQITDKYISGGDSITSRSGDRNERTFTDEIKDLKTMLDNVNNMYDRTQKSQADLSSAETKINKYLETIPTLWPVKTEIKDSFGYRKDPFTGRKTYHEGLDLSGDIGDHIKAAAGGKVILAESHGGYGRAVIIDHGHGLTTLYGHSSKLLVKAGQVVKKGDVIAEVGSSGRSTGPHLHFEIMLYSTPVDPLKYLDAR